MRTYVPQTSVNGQYEIKTENGIRVSVSSAQTDLILVVHQISAAEKESYGWIESCVLQAPAGFIPFDMYFVTPSEERIELNSDDVITFSPSNATDYVLGLSCAEKTVDISHTVKDGKISFHPRDSSNYYILCKGVNKPPQTGDTFEIYVWFLTLMISGSLLFALLIHKKKAQN